MGVYTLGQIYSHQNVVDLPRQGEVESYLLLLPIFQASPITSIDFSVLISVASICSTSSGPSFFRTNFPIEITSRISPLWSHTAFPMILAIFNLGNTLIDTSRNCFSLYRCRCKRRNRDCKGLESLVISLHAPNTFAPLILKSYCLRIWSTLMCPLSMKLSSFT